MVAQRVVLVTMTVAPLVAHAEERDISEISHAIVLLGMIGILFLCALSFAIYLLVARLRADAEERAAAGPAAKANLESIWFPKTNAISDPSSPPSPQS